MNDIPAPPAAHNWAVDPVALAAELIRRPSVTPKDEGALGIVAARLERLGFTCHPLTFTEEGHEPVANLYARWGTGKPNLCFAGHTDVVPTGAADQWSFDPFGAALREGVLCGRGAVDMKGAIAAFIAAAERFIATRGPDFPGSISVLITGDEEGVAVNGTKKVLEWLKARGEALDACVVGEPTSATELGDMIKIGRRGPDFPGSISLLITGDEEGVAVNGTKKVLEWLKARGEALDACVVGEPTSATELGDMIKIGRRGSMTGLLTVAGVQGHVAYPHLADNAAHRIIAQLHALTAMPLDPGTEHFQRSGLQVTTIDIGNPTTNIIPGAARATFNIRFNDLWTSDKLKEWVAKRLAMAGGNYHLQWEVSGEAFLVPPGRISDCLGEAIRTVTGRTPELSTTGGTSDARFIQAFCPVAEFGLVGETMHKADERVPVADIAQLVAIYEAFLDRFFATA